MRTFLDPAREADLERDGFVVIPFLDADEVAGLSSAYWDQLGVAPGDPGRACISTFHSYDAEYKSAVSETVHTAFGPHLERYFDRQRVLPANFLTKWPGGMSGFGLHYDLSLVDEKEHRSVEVWCALTDTTEENGQLWVAPGSHTWAPTIRGIHAFPSPFAGVEKRIIDNHSVPVPLKAGEAIVFNHATLHFSYPNKSETPRLVAIVDLIPEEAKHLHYFGDEDGKVHAYEIGDDFWVDQNPFTLYKAPSNGVDLGIIDFDPPVLTDADLDRLVAEGRAVSREAQRRGAINPGRAWCHRCGTTEGMEGSPNRWSGNVTMLCADCKAAEPVLAGAPA